MVNIYRSSDTTSIESMLNISQLSLSFQGGILVIIPVYANHELFVECIHSVLGQEGIDVRVLVLDNGGFGKTSCKPLIDKINDSRIIYYRNPSNIGSQPNFGQAFFFARLSYRFMILPADMSLVPGSLSLMSKQLDSSGCSLCFGRTLLHDSVYLRDFNPNRQSSYPVLPWPHYESQTVDSAKLIHGFFSRHNLNSEWTHFTYIGALIDASVFRSIPDLFPPFYDHGGEIYISLSLLIFTNNVYIQNTPTLVHHLGAKRHGSAIRPTNGYTRYEPLAAQVRFLNKYECLLQRKNVLVPSLRFKLLCKILFSLFRYRLFMRVYFPSILYLAISVSLRCLLDTTIAPALIFQYVYSKVMSFHGKRTVESL